MDPPFAFQHATAMAHPQLDIITTNTSMSASRRTPSKASKQRSAEVMRLRAKYADLYGKPPRGPCENDAQWLQQKLDEAARWRGRTLIMPPSPAQMGGFNMGKALLLALLCAPAVGVALTDLGDSTPRSLTTHPTGVNDLAGVTAESCPPPGHPGDLRVYCTVPWEV